MSDYTVRIRFRMPRSPRLRIQEPQAVYEPKNQPAVALRSLDRDSALEEAAWLVLQSAGWPSEEEAAAAGERLMDALRIALARLGMSADLGRRAPQGGFFRTALERFAEERGRPVLNDVHGLMVFPSAPRPLLARLGKLVGLRSVQPERWEKVFLFALSVAPELTERERVAFDVYDAAFWVQESADARFALLWAAVEVLLEEVPRPAASIAHVDDLIEQTKKADLEDAEMDSLCGSLAWLRKQSIRTTGRELVRERLSDRRYGHRTAERLFLDCYDLRNRLLHGHLPFPTRQEVGSLAASLQQMAGHLLAGPALELNV